MATHGPSSLNGRRSLHLHIDPFTYKSQIHPSPQSNSPQSAATSASLGVTGTPTTMVEPPIYSVLCMYDFRSEDPDHLPFHKNEILEIVKQEDTGWWAALRRDGDQIGWIPQAFVKPISDDMAEKLRNTKKELRCYEYDAEQLYTSAPTRRIPPLYESSEPNTPSLTLKRPDVHGKVPTPHSKLQNLPSQMTGPESERPIQYNQSRDLPSLPSSIPIPQPPYTSSYHDKPTLFRSSGEKDILQIRDRAGSLPTQTPKGRLGIVEDHSVSTGLLTLHESSSSGDASDLSGAKSSSSLDNSAKRMRSQMLTRVNGIPSQRPTHARAWYLEPNYADQLDMDADGHVRFGTLEALVEKLIKTAEETAFRNIFLMTFRTFTTADVLFDMFVEIYQMDHPKDLTSAEFEDWKTHLIRIQQDVLVIFTMWLEDHRLLEEEPHIAQRLTEFLQLIAASPSGLASAARLLMKKIQHQTFAIPPNISPVTSPRKVRKSRAHKNDLLKLEPLDVAEQLALFEFQRYVKITPQECLAHAGTPTTPPKMGNLSAFCSTHDKLAAWVKTSVLNNDALGKRADTIEFWIKVAESCKALNNFASMSAVINGLSSTVITRLHLTWAHVGRRSTLDALLRYNEPTGSFSGYRNLLRDVEGSCVPFIGMFLTEIVHIYDQFSDDGDRLCFLKRQRWYETIITMLRYQSRPYEIAESELTMGFITKHLLEDNIKDPSWFWSRSQDVQQFELAHADIRKGLEAAGF